MNKAMKDRLEALVSVAERAGWIWHDNIETWHKVYSQYTWYNQHCREEYGVQRHVHGGVELDDPKAEFLITTMSHQDIENFPREHRYFMVYGKPRGGRPFFLEDTVFRIGKNDQAYPSQTRIHELRRIYEIMERKYHEQYRRNKR